ncbi:Transcriptional regulator HilA [Luteitalea pratensis]|uniref:Transcriptional regulator HilA n=1 Tax=Luteitalea pratensis TaxID=1855912 RepID=A0A143PHE5_LUTPR|nr:winged helix-turn-helix domain-containing protein [Luteitalea pratensis]AMY07941.1 Transcriptional regulator HilA [Luteitalea pratensis]
MYEFGEFRLDEAERLLSRRGVTVPLTPKAFDLLLALVDQPGRLLDKETLLSTLWPDSFVEENNLADNIFKLRRVLGDGENGRRFIETVPKRGYRFVADVRAVAPLTAQGPELAPQVVAEPPRQAEAREGQVPLPATNTRRLVTVPWLVAAAMTLLVVALWIGQIRRGTPDPPRLLKASLLPPEDASFGDIALSPDGKWLAFTAATGSRVQLWLRSLAHDKAIPVESTDGASHPFWSPDSRVVGFFASGKLKKVELGGGLPVPLCRASAGTGGTWNREGVILFTVLGVPQILRVSASGGTPEVVLHADPGQTDLHEPFFLPDGRRFLYLAISGGKKNAGGIHVGSLDGKLRQRVLDHDSNAIFVAGDPNDRHRGYLLFGREGGLMALAFDSDGLHTSGEAEPIAARLGTVQGANLSYRRRNFTAADNGLLIYDPHIDRQRSQLLWVDRHGTPLHVLAQLDNVGVPVLSPDESRIVVARKDLATNNNDLWLTDPLGDNPAKFTFDPGSDLLGIWSPDGQRIVWTSTRNGSFDLYEKEVSSQGTDTPLLRSEQPKFPLDWSRDGRFLLYRQIGPQTNHDIFVLPTSGQRKPSPYLQTAAMENGGAFSPNANWIAYSSDESGLVEVYVESFPTHGGKRQISLAGGSGPRWRADGKELYYYSFDGTLMAVSVAGGGASLTTGTPTVLFPFRPASATSGPTYAVTRNGERFLLSAIVETDPKAPLSIVQNWTAGLSTTARYR